MPPPSQQYIFNNTGGYTAGNFPGASGWSYGGRDSAMGSAPAPSGGFMSSVGHGFGSIGSGLAAFGSGIGHAVQTGLSMLPGFSGGSTGGGVTASAGGWSIDANGNLTGGGGNQGIPMMRQGPSPISHTTSIPASAMAAMADVRKRNQI